MFLLLDKKDDNRIIDICEIAEIVEAGIFTGKAIYSHQMELIIAEVSEVPKEVKISQYFYQEGQFVKDENWSPYTPQEQQIRELKTQLDEMTILLAAVVGGAI